MEPGGLGILGQPTRSASLGPKAAPAADAPTTVGSILAAADRPASLQTAASASAAASAPLPVARPANLAAPDAADKLAGRTRPRRAKSAARAVPAEDDRSLFERLFGIGAAPVTYASLPGDPTTARPASGPASPAGERGTAIYDITAQTVTLPGGERLEAHSGLGERRDDPRFVHVRMQGATPPGTYDLTLREAAFHGVRALRLNPVGGPAAIHNRAGLLAHTFMLGPRGDSNGCVSFRDYGRFLDAYLRGDIRRLVVVAGSGWTRPSFASTGERAGG